MEEKYLPIGSVVLLKNGTKPVMITGYLPMPSDSSDTTMYDYSACMFPEGLLSSDQNAVFNHEQIDKFLFVGFKNEESMEFLNEVKTIANLHREEQLGVAQNITATAPVVEQTPQVVPTQAIPPQPIAQTSGPQIQSNPFADPIFTNNYPQQQQQGYTMNNNGLPNNFNNNNMFY